MAEQRTTKDRKRHLYLVFDDWHSGYSIRKLALTRRSGKRAQQTLPSSSGEGAAVPVPLPEPEVIMRIEALRGFPQYFEAAFGNKIVPLHPGIADGFKGIPMIDVEDLTIVYGPEPDCVAYPIHFPVGDNKLFVLDIGTFDCYLWRPEHSQPWWREDLPYPPFRKADVSSYGILPDGCVLFSVKSGTGTTFIYDTKEDVWNPYGNWVLPFAGRGHYDTCLEGFVGLSKDPETLGYLYCSTMASIRIRTGITLHPCPDFKRSKEKVFNKNPDDGHVSATLVHMGPGKFCLVECVSIGKRMTDQELPQELRAGVPRGADPWDFVGGAPQRGRFMYRLKTFFLSCDMKGGPMTLKNCKVRCYSLPHDAKIGSIYQDPVAFWL